MAGYLRAAYARDMEEETAMHVGARCSGAASLLTGFAIAAVCVGMAVAAPGEKALLENTALTDWTLLQPVNAIHHQ